MHHPADSTTELCHCVEHDNAGGKSIPMYLSSGEKTELEVVDGSVFVCLY